MTLREKSKQTNLNRIGVEYPAQNKDVLKKMKQTTFERHGVEYCMQSEVIREKAKQTNLERHGVEYSSQREDVKEKIRKTLLERYGVENVMFVPEFVEKAIRNMFRVKIYKLPSGKEIKLQGYEPFAMDYLFEVWNLSESQITSGAGNVPEIHYNDLDIGKDHRYYTDIFIPHKNLCIEVKSLYTLFQQDYIKNLLKHRATIDAGYIHVIWVFDRKGNRLFKHTNETLRQLVLDNFREKRNEFLKPAWKEYISGWERLRKARYIAKHTRKRALREAAQHFLILHDDEFNQ